MWAETLYPLSNRQKWKLGFGLAIIYVPIRIYVIVTLYNTSIVLHKLPLWVIELAVSVLFYTLWLNVIEWLQHYISRFPAGNFLVRYKFLNQLMTLLIAIGLAVMFNTAFRAFWHWMESIWDPHIPHVSSAAELILTQQKRRADNGLTVMALMAAYYLASNVRVYQRLQQVHINAERLEKENIKAHFNALKNQVSPHFLFNNFSVLSTLVETDKELSIEFISRLSQAYRYILEQSDFDQIKLRTEIEFLKTYMYLLKTRFEDKINLEIQLSDAQMDSYSIVPLTLQLLVENAVKHNQMSVSCPLVITILIQNDLLIIQNPIQLRETAEASTGIGLHNIINRYKLLINKPVLIGNQKGRFVENPSDFMNVLIIEDETLSAARLENLIFRHDAAINVLARIPSVKESIIWLQNDNNAKPDLIFLDIMLEDGHGFQIIEQLQLTIPIIFTTAYNEYALKAFKVNSVDYLLKPVNASELDIALHKFKDLHLKNRTTFPDLSDLKSWLQTPIQQENYKERFMASAGTRLFSVKTAEIAYFTIEQKATYLKTFDGKHLTMDYSLDKLIQLLDPNQFFRINRSLIISLGSISSINALSAGRLKLELAPAASQEIYVSTDRITDFKQWLGK